MERKRERLSKKRESDERGRLIDGGMEKER